ncbi:unnamed protein product [Anisakis simplex]|uniref:Late expression factor 11 n=1 Tax=Anisakis simplex TaxID=6269 RepID=A0A0M3JC79_ANISI|nr:unnamed protein product [Anisakis simplex]
MPRDQYLRATANSNAYISEQIRNEIQRFESVHPCIYTVYDLIELIPDQMLQNQLRDQVVCIEGQSTVICFDALSLHALLFRIYYSRYACALTRMNRITAVVWSL